MVEQTFAILGTIADKHNTLVSVTVLYDKVYLMANKKTDERESPREA